MQNYIFKTAVCLWANLRMVSPMEMGIMSLVMDLSIMEKWKKAKLILMMATYKHFYLPTKEALKIIIFGEKANNKQNPILLKANTTMGRKSLEF